MLRGTGARPSIGFGLGHLAQAYLYDGSVDRATGVLREAIGLVEEEEHSTAIAYFRNLLGLALFWMGDDEAAEQVYRKNLDYSAEIGHW